MKAPHALRRKVPGFGPYLRECRLAASLSQNFLAHRAGLDPAYVNRLERAPADAGPRPSREALLRLASALGLDDQETDRFLYRAGHSPAVDWQSRAELAESRLARVRKALGPCPDEPA